MNRQGKLANEAELGVCQREGPVIGPNLRRQASHDLKESGMRVRPNLSLNVTRGSAEKQIQCQAADMTPKWYNLTTCYLFV